MHNISYFFFQAVDKYDQLKKDQYLSLHHLMQILAAPEEKHTIYEHNVIMGTGELTEEMSHFKLLRQEKLNRGFGMAHALIHGYTHAKKATNYNP